MKLVVIGSSNMDLVISLPRIPAIGETVSGGKYSMVFGGKGANQAVAALRAGGDMGFISKVGDDLFGNKIKAHFKSEGFRSDLILTDDHAPTGIAQIFVSKKGENSIGVAPGANMKLLPEDIEPFKGLIAASSVVLLQLETPMETIEHLAELSDRYQVKLILNPAPAQPLPKKLMKKVWLITPNETEAELLTGTRVSDKASAQQAAAQLLKMGVKNAIVTLGEQGSLLNQNGTVQHFPAYPAQAVDTTAAGDVFNGTLAMAITKGKTLEAAIKFAAAAAAISVTRKGAQPSIPIRTEIDNFIEKINR